MGRLALPQVTPEYAQSNCTACRLNCNSKLQLAGGGKQRVLVLTDKQDAIQQSTKTYMRGEHYTYIRDVLYQYGLTTDDYWMTSTVQCYCDKPTEANAIHCKPNIIKLIKTLKPVLIIGFGQFTASVLLSDSIVDGSTNIERVHGFLHPDRKLNCNILVTYAPHPSAYAKDSVEDKLIRRDVHVAVKSLRGPVRVFKDEQSCVRMLSPKDAAAELERRIRNESRRLSALDYETNCLKPYNANSRIVSCAISEDWDDSFAFMVDEVTEPVLMRYWQTSHIAKIAHNTAFERTWTMVKLGVRPYRLIHDSMLLAHGLDNRPDILSIKFLAPMLTGCDLWNKHIEPYFETDKKKYGEYGLNKINEIPVRQLLMYNGIDSLVEYRVFHILMDYIKDYYGTFPTDENIEEYRNAY